MKHLVTLSLMACAMAACSPESPPASVYEGPAKIVIDEAHKHCTEDAQCERVFNDCMSGCDCGEAVNEAFAAQYKARVLGCRKDRVFEQCDYECPHHFIRCSKGTCELTNEPPDLLVNGASVKSQCETTGGTYLGCPSCARGAICETCLPCRCSSRAQWQSSGCKVIVKTEPSEIDIGINKSSYEADETIKITIRNNAAVPIWVLLRCESPTRALRLNTDQIDAHYGFASERSCVGRKDALPPGERRSYDVGPLSQFKRPGGEAIRPGRYRFDVTYTDNADQPIDTFFGTVSSPQLEVRGMPPQVREAVSVLISVTAYAAEHGFDERKIRMDKVAKALAVIESYDPGIKSGTWMRHAKANLEVRYEDGRFRQARVVDR